MKKYFIILGCIQAFIALGAIPAGIGYLNDPTGTGLGTSVEILKDSPFSDFLIPALFLLIVNGLGNVFGTVLSLRKKPIAGKAGFVLGVILCFWILIQVYWIGLISFMQPMFLIIGIIEGSLGLIIIKKHKNGKFRIT
ncbi:MAG: hypothetical protein UR43_C0026G0007 [candidate division TM6 bacterium GW2011_GWF2_33_332]|nr:MAG: hypothetical protein UR43_C0026G0007 [candidate division TM6 bacterium GW2011_GWF2_33_332]